MAQASGTIEVVDTMLMQQLAVDPVRFKLLRVLLCQLLKRQFDNTLKFNFRLNFDLGGVYEIPFAKDVGLPGGEDIPHVYVDPGEEVGLVVTTEVNPRWVALLNQGLALGCEWAVEVAASLSDR